MDRPIDVSLVKKPLTTDLELLLKTDSFIAKDDEVYLLEKRDGEPGLFWKLDDERVLFHAESEYQRIMVVHTVEEGRMLLIDGQTMMSDNSERCYHEPMAHTGMILHPEPKKVLILGGGDGGIVREMLKHGTVEKVVQCDIDELVSEVSRCYFPAVSKDITPPLDKRVELVYQDACAYLKGVDDKDERFDVVVFDLCDPDAGPSSRVFEDAALRGAHRCLSDDGVLVMQAEAVSTPRYREWRDKKCAELKDMFRTVAQFRFRMPIYPTQDWTGIVAGKGYLNPLMPYSHPPKGLEEFGLDMHKAGFLYMRGK